jgi:hypothetical protein
MADGKGCSLVHTRQRAVRKIISNTEFGIKERKMIERKKKMMLNKETLRQLGDGELNQAVGGTIDLSLLQLAQQLILSHFLKKNSVNKASANGGDTTTSGVTTTVSSAPTTGG